jgi:hypothetical protein
MNESWTGCFLTKLLHKSRMRTDDLHTFLEERRRIERPCKDESAIITARNLVYVPPRPLQIKNEGREMFISKVTAVAELSFSSSTKGENFAIIRKRNTMLTTTSYLLHPLAFEL